MSGASAQQLGGLKQQLENTLKVAYTKNYSMGLQKAANAQPVREKEPEQEVKQKPLSIGASASQALGAVSASRPTTQGSEIRSNKKGVDVQNSAYKMARFTPEKKREKPLFGESKHVNAQHASSLEKFPNIRLKDSQSISTEENFGRAHAASDAGSQPPYPLI